MTTLKSSGNKEFDAAMKAVVAGINEQMEVAGSLWADECVEQFNEYVPVDSGNLRDSIDADELEPGRKYVVGVNERLLTAGEDYPDFNYVYKAGWNENRYLPAITKDRRLRGFIKKIWFEIAKQNIRKEFM